MERVVTRRSAVNDVEDVDAFDDGGDEGGPGLGGLADGADAVRVGGLAADEVVDVDVVRCAARRCRLRGGRTSSRAGPG